LRRIAYQASYLRLNWNINVEGAADSLRELNKYDWLTRDDLQEWRQHLEDIVNMRRQSECLSIAMRLFQDAVDGTLEEEQIISVDLKFAESLRKLNCRAKELVDLKNALLNERTILSVARMKVAVEARGLRVRKAMDSG